MTAPVCTCSLDVGPTVPVSFLAALRRDCAEHGERCLVIGCEAVATVTTLSPPARPGFCAPHLAELLALPRGETLRLLPPTVGSLFAGIGAGDLGLERAGFRIAWQAEIDPFCNKVLAAHWPEVMRHGDVRDIRAASFRLAGRGVNDANGEGDSAAYGDATHSRDLDLIIGGFPCQDVSVAGKRAGLHGERSGLWFEFQRILRELRPRWALIENVPGLLSDGQGRSFATVLDGLGECGFGGIAWAVLDSQHWGVAQRRRRVFIVCGPSSRSVEQVLSLCEGCGGHTAPRREAREDVAPTLRAGANRTGGDRPPGTDVDTVESLQIVGALTANDRQRNGAPEVDGGHFIVAHSLRAEGFDASDDGTGRGTPLTVIQDARGVRDKAQNGIGIQESETMYTLAGVSQHAVAFTERSRKDGRNFEAQEELSYALTNPGSGGRTHSRQLYDGLSVRRLTPTECERLQGLPDGWTDVDGAKDGPRYRALGNAMTMPVIEHLGRRIMALLRPADRLALGIRGVETLARGQERLEI